MQTYFSNSTEFTYCIQTFTINTMRIAYFETEIFNMHNITIHYSDVCIY